MRNEHRGQAGRVWRWSTEWRNLKLEGSKIWVEDQSYKRSWRKGHQEVTTRKTLEGTQREVSRFISKNTQ